MFKSFFVAEVALVERDDEMVVEKMDTIDSSSLVCGVISFFSNSRQALQLQQSDIIRKQEQ